MTTSTPEQARREGVGRQRLVVVLALFVVILAVVAWPGNVGTSAVAQDQSDAYQPFHCQQGTTAQQRRQAIQQKGSGTDQNFNGSGYARPCVSGVKWHMQAGNLSDSNTSDVIASVHGINARSLTDKVFFAGSGSQALYQLAFKDLVFADNVADYGPIRLTADSATSPDVQSPTAHTLSITPDGPITIGGSGVRTEVVATGDSYFAIPWAKVQEMSGLADLVGKGSICTAGYSGNVCKIKLSTLAGSGSGLLGSLIAAIVSSLAQGGDFNLINLNLDFYYLWTHRMDGSDPYTNIPVDGAGSPLNSIQLPKTTITVN